MLDGAGDLALAGLGGTVKVGAILAGKYRVERIIGSGGMGVVVASASRPVDLRAAGDSADDARLGDAPVGSAALAASAAKTDPPRPPGHAGTTNPPPAIKPTPPQAPRLAPSGGSSAYDDRL